MTAGALTWIFGGGAFAAFLLGWLAHWLWALTTRPRAHEAERVEQLASELLQAEAERDAFRTAKETTETTLTHDFSERAEDLEAKLREREAELAAAMEGLGEARREINQLKGVG